MRRFIRLFLALMEMFNVKIIRKSFYDYLLQPNALELCIRYKIECSSILHIGGHFAEEASLYHEAGIKDVTFIEGDPNLFPKMKKALNQYPGYIAILAMLSDKDEETSFYVASNEGASSSLLAPFRHKEERPDIAFGQVKLVKTVTLDSLKLGSFDLVVLDVQGAEHLVIQGGMETIKRANAIWIEVNAGSMYLGDLNSSEIIACLSDYFVPLYMNMGENKWGDALLMNKSLLLSA